ncbi:hypothetical protein [Pseudoalteromonas luteoviolacea]|uniref:Lipoprotein n=1 Tax=Pseudoalteromonas luteoviolacea H33 TaxID=1365251 RepID=A0A167FKD1_9GAMM|nr:hypothetical protein [Pseudoalteromonas luteoviolacea]KZN52439.1 hypothetical protein N476_10240 [Pseudoalteromonas luteoviolacea H33]KZN76629.1 hypothetical protein N477_16105 [Pseudoalteromonas luteoviolacea H33-S]MBQ4877125.1 hypothetical protein [Pseudoalteromonas luteoviolacea]MBQ4905986.1 hypothetical protein [Pseudoalteromonas luteoviolacea]
MLCYSRFWVSIGALTLAACQTTKTNSTPPSVQVPCWLNKPVSSQHIGFIGTAAPFSAIKDGSIIASRQRAVSHYTQYYGLPSAHEKIKQLPATQNRFTLNNGQVLYFSEPYITSDTLYTYVSNRPIINSNQCETVSCNFSLCEPKWLCSGENNHVIGASYYTAFAHQQLPMTATNAKALAGYLAQASVNMQERYIESFSEQQHTSQFFRQGEVIGNEYHQPLLMTQSCHYGSTLFAAYQTNQSINKQITQQTWRDIQQYQGRSVVMGNFGEDGTIAPDNLISSAIRYAIHDALVEIAKNKGVTVSASSTLLNQNGRYYLSDAQFDIQQTVSGQLLDLQINYKAGFPIVYVWLLESES